MYGSFLKMLIFAVLFAVVIFFSANPQAAPFKEDLTLQAVMAALGGILIIVVLVERSTEIFISIWRQSAADGLKKEIEAFGGRDAQNEALVEKQKALGVYRAETKNIALLVGFTIAVIVCSAGVGLLGTLIDTFAGNTGFIRGVDIVLTSGLIAGGSDGFHQFTSALETFFTESKRNMASKS